MSAVRKIYPRSELAVVWQPSLCIHSEKCFHGLPGVFDPARRPWIDVNAATAEEIIAQVGRCPSGALSIEYPPGAGAQPAAQGQAAAAERTRVEVLRDGPLLVHGEITVIGADGRSEARSGSTALCRCGASKNKPYCDGSHKTIDFRG